MGEKDNSEFKQTNQLSQSSSWVWVEPAEENVAQSDPLSSLGNKCPWQTNTIRTKISSTTFPYHWKEKMLTGTMEMWWLVIIQLKGNINWDLHRIWMPNKTITMKFEEAKCKPKLSRLQRFPTIVYTKVKLNRQGGQSK